MKSSVIFLDIDGVLNDYKTKDRIGRIIGVNDDLIIYLKQIVDLLDADIVLSSSWREYCDKSLISDGVDNWLGCSKKRYGRYLNIRLGKFGLKIADKTEEFPRWVDRGPEILNYLDKHPEIEYFVILDDEDFRWRRYGLEGHWINTVEDTGEWYFRNDGLKSEHVDYIRDNMEKFRRYSYGSC